MVTANIVSCLHRERRVLCCIEKVKIVRPLSALCVQRSMEHYGLSRLFAVSISIDGSQIVLRSGECVRDLECSFL